MAKIPEQPPGYPQGKHSLPMSKEGLCRCGECQTQRLHPELRGWQTAGPQKK